MINRKKIIKLLLKGFCISFFFMMFITCENPFVSSILPEKGNGVNGGYEYTVTFDKNDGSTVPYAVIVVKSSQKTINALPSKPERENYFFKEWNTDRGGNGKVFDEKTEVTGDITVFAKWVNDELTGSAAISGIYRIGEVLSINIDDITGAEPPFIYQWKADDEDITGAGGETHIITGADAGKIISCVVTHDKAAGEITAAGETVPYDIKIIMTGNTENDSVTVTPDFGKAGDTVTINYLLSDTKKNNIIDFFGVDLDSVTEAGSGNISYIIIADNASADGVITINAIFTHTDLEIDHISFTDNHNETVTYGDTGFTKVITNAGSGSGAITYESSDTSVAAVNNSGVVTIFKIGSVTITAVKESDGNYAQARASYTLTIQQRQLIIADPSVTTTKKYDGTNTAAVTAGELQNKVAGDVVNVSALAAYASANAGTGILITVVYSISGEDSGNYIKPADYTTTGSITQDTPSVDPNLFTKIDFQNDSLGSTTKYVSTKGSGTAALSIVSDSNPAGNKALQIVTGNYNQAAIIPINLPYELNNYQSISVRIKPTAGTSALNGKSIHIYAASSVSDFLDYGFGNPANSQYNQYANRLIGQSETLNFGASPYFNVWTEFSLDNIAASGGTIVGNLKGSAYIAIGLNVDNTAGTYLIDDIDFILKNDFEPPPPPPSFPEPPSTGAVASGKYRNLFLERGLWTQTQIDAKVNSSWNRLFNDTSEAYRIYYEVNTPSGPGAYIYDSGNNDVRSEGMSYGMMMAVQMGDKEKFDRLWRWSRHYMYTNTNKGNNSRGYFAWQMNTDGSVKGSVGIAPDGEFYFATALLFAHARWGSNTGTGTMVQGSNTSSDPGGPYTLQADILNYRYHAMQLLFDMINRRWSGYTNNDPWDAPGLFRRPGDHRSSNTAANPMTLGNYMPVFSPIGASSNHTDPSYHLPAFYEVWVYEMEKDADAGITHGVWSNVQQMRDDIAFYKTVIQTSRAFFKNATHPQTGLAADYSTFSGEPTGSQNYFGYDAFRVAMNITMDYAWWAADPWQKTFADRILSFFHSKGVNTYKALWNWDGAARDPHGDHSPGLVACNAVAGLAATHERAWDFIEDFWSISMTPNTYRYYDGCLYMLGMLNLSGNYKVYLSGGTYAQDSNISPTSAAFDKRPSQQQNITVTMTLNGNSFVSIHNGQTALTQGTHYTRSGDTITFLSSYLAALPNGTTTLAFKFSAGRDRSIDIAVTTSAAQNSTITPTTAVFAKHDPSDISVMMTLNGNTLSSIRNGGTTLVQGSQYTASGGNVSILAAYLNGFNAGTQTLTFYFSEGNNAVLTVTVQEYPPSEISPETAVFYKDTLGDVEVTMTLKGNTLTSIQKNGASLALNADYTRNGDIVTILASYLVSQPAGKLTLVFVFNQGGNKEFVISIEDVNPDRMVKIDFEETPPAITFTGGGGTPTAAVTANPTVPNEKSLQITVTGGNNWNRAPIIPVNLPQELQYYKSLSFKYYVQSATNAVTRDFRVYADDKNNGFPSNQFGNANAYFTDRLISGFQIDLTETGVWKEHTIQISSLPSLIANLKGNIFIAIGFNHGEPYTYYLDDITFVLDENFVIPASINPVTAVFYKAANEQEDIRVTMTLNGHSLTSIQNGAVTLASGTHYTVNGNEVTLLKSYLAGLANGKSTLTFNFSKGPGSNIEITVEADKASAMKLSYNFSTLFDAGSVVHSGAANLSVTWADADGALQITKSNNGTNYYITLPFNLGTADLSNYKLVVTIRGVSGDYGNKPFAASISGGASLGSISNSSLGTSYKDVELTSLPAATGNISINFNFINNNANNYTIQIREIKLVLK